MLNNPKKLFIITAVVIVLVAVFFILERTKISPEVFLEASTDKMFYESGEEVVLSVSWTNSGSVDTCVSDMDAGSIRFISFTRDGEQVETRSAPSYFITSFIEMLEVSLKTVVPGESMDIVMVSRVDPGLGRQALRTTTLEDGRGIGMFYDVETPGDYNLELIYEYPGPPFAGCPSIFQGATNIVRATFTVN